MAAVDLHCARTCVAVLALFLGAAQTAAADGLRAGQWRTVNSPEIDGVAGPVQQTIRCLTPEAVADLDKTFSPISRTTNSTCERVEHERTPLRAEMAPAMHGPDRHGRGGRIHVRQSRTLHGRHHRALIHAGPPHAIRTHVGGGSARGRLPLADLRDGGRLR